jgi:hypothetical protein
MPEQFVINGVGSYEEGVRTRADFSALEGAGTATKGTVGLLMETSRGGKPTTGQEITSAATLRRLIPEPYATYLEKTLFAPGKQSDRIPMGAQKIIFVRVNKAEQGTLTLVNDDGDAVDLKSADYGLYANDILVTVANGTSVGRKVTAVLGSVTEVVDDAGDLDALQLKFTAPDTPGYTVLGMVATVDPDVGVQVDFDLRHADNSTWDWTAANNKMAIDGPLTITIEHTELANKVFVVTGRNKANGAVTVENVQIDAGLKTETSLTEWSEITSIELPDLLDGGNNNRAEFTGHAFDLPVATYDTISKVAARVATKAAAGFTATLKTAKTSFLVSDLDKASDQTIVGGHTFTADLYDFIEDVNAGLTLITAERAASVTAAGLPNTIGETAMAGGNDGLYDDGTSWTDALKELKKWGKSLLLPMTADAGILASCLDHCVYMWGRGKYECAMFAAPPAQTDLTGEDDDNLYAKTRAFNSELVTFTPQEIKLYDHNRVAQWLSPMWTAALACGCEAGRSPDYGLTHAYVDVVDYRDNPDGDSPWTVEDQTEELLGHGCFVLERNLSTGGVRWKRDVTTYQIDSNPIKSSLFAMTQFALSTRDLREWLEIQIGKAQWTGSRKDVEKLARQRLEYQIGAKMIKAFKPRTVKAIDLGNGFRVDWHVAPAETTYFIEAVAHPMRMPS